MSNYGLPCAWKSWDETVVSLPYTTHVGGVHLLHSAPSGQFFSRSFSIVGSAPSSGHRIVDTTLSGPPFLENRPSERDMFAMGNVAPASGSITNYNIYLLNSTRDKVSNSPRIANDAASAASSTEHLEKNFRFNLSKYSAQETKIQTLFQSTLKTWKQDIDFLFGESEEGKSRTESSSGNIGTHSINDEKNTNAYDQMMNRPIPFVEHLKLLGHEEDVDGIKRKKNDIFSISEEMSVQFDQDLPENQKLTKIVKESDTNKEEERAREDMFKAWKHLTTNFSDVSIPAPRVDEVTNKPATSPINSQVSDDGVEEEDTDDPDRMLHRLLQISKNVEDTGISSFMARKGQISYKWARDYRMTMREIEEAERNFKYAMEWPFKLDTFQREAIIHMEGNKSTGAAVFITAHTSSGKTVVAEYAIAMAMVNKSRVVYTSPIKALSNQKYAEFRKLFGGPDGKQVGIITGDVSINPDAPCLVMTTEIFRSMLYRNDPMVQDTSCIIFDEIHYMNNRERGPVYEEILILLPSNIGLVFLSATTSNAMVFAEWCGTIKQKEVWVIGTKNRVVPLMHYIYPALLDKPENVLVMDGLAMDKGLPNAWKFGHLKSLQKKYDEKFGSGEGSFQFLSDGNIKGRHLTQIWVKFFQSLKNSNLLPCIVFSFQRQTCNDLAFHALEGIDECSKEEKSAIVVLFKNAVSKLSVEDRDLPQINFLYKLAMRGIGVHHAGILPIMKEVVELLFSKGYIRILFATETFAMGVNMPARSVVFSSLLKFDSELGRRRPLRPDEYTQMAGRAGRRGLDSAGTVIFLSLNEGLPPTRFHKGVLAGNPASLASQFAINWTTILNSIRSSIPLADVLFGSFSNHNNKEVNFVDEYAHVFDNVELYLQFRKSFFETVNSETIFKTNAGNFLTWDETSVTVDGVKIPCSYRSRREILTMMSRFFAEINGFHTILSKLSIPQKALLTPGSLLVLQKFAFPTALSESKKYKYVPAVALRVQDDGITTIVLCPYTLHAKSIELATQETAQEPTMKPESAFGSMRVLKREDPDDELLGLGFKKKGDKGKKGKKIEESRDVSNSMSTSVRMNSYVHLDTASSSGATDRSFFVTKLNINQVYFVGDSIFETGQPQNSAVVTEEEIISIGRHLVNSIFLTKEFGEYFANDPSAPPKENVDSIIDALFVRTAAINESLIPSASLPKLMELRERYPYKSLENQRLEMMRTVSPVPRCIVEEAVSIQEVNLAMQAVIASASRMKDLLLSEVRRKISSLEQLKYVERVEHQFAEIESIDISNYYTTMKGYAATEVSCAHPLLVTEIIFQGVFDSMTPAEIVALLSSFVLQNKGQIEDIEKFFTAVQTLDTLDTLDIHADDPEANELRFDENDYVKTPIVTPALDLADVTPEVATLPSSGAVTEAAVEDETTSSQVAEGTKLQRVREYSTSSRLRKAIRSVMRIALALGKVLHKVGEITDIDNFVRENVNFSIVVPVYVWASGGKFSTVVHLAKISEGDIVRHINRTQTLLQEVKRVSKICGDLALYEKVIEADTAIKRGIIFAPSLYY